MTDTIITVLYGYKEFKLKAPTLRKEIVKKYFWFNKEQYYIDWEYCSLGPMTLKEAQYYIGIARNV